MCVVLWLDLLFALIRSIETQIFSVQGIAPQLTPLLPQPCKSMRSFTTHPFLHQSSALADVNHPSAAHTP